MPMTTVLKICPLQHDEHTKKVSHDAASQRQGAIVRTGVFARQQPTWKRR